FADYFAEELSGLSCFAEDGMISLNDKQLVVENKGRLFIRNICMTFDAYLKQQAKLTRFSRVI
ncbi:MAG: oxygen-independent coproporphyrinogen III oxidase, partial [Pseudomonadota bacterium]|nr:oxygen-independent coproporphyrinogen III oxidase [Pseudomonadota bacterium]